MKIHNHIIPKAIRRHSIRLWLATAITMTATLAVLTGCSADNEPENPTGGDGTSVTFGATIATREGHDNGNAPTSRAIPDGTFEEGDWILVHIDGERKVFVYRTADGGFVHDPSISSLNIDPTPPEWKSGETGKDVLAYGPTGVIMYDVNEGYVFQCAVAKDQSKDKDYEGRDYVYAAQSLDRGNPALTFRHGMTRVVVRLRPGGSLTSEEVAGASVLLGDKNIFLVADIDPQTGTLTAHVPTGGNQLQPQTVTPHRCAATPTGYAVAYEALLPPQDVSGKLFISARLSNGTELGYAAESGSMLEGGHEYIYNVTVEENRLVVTVTDSDVPWQDGILTTKIDGTEFRLIRTAEDLARFARDVNGDGVTPGSGKTDLNALQVADIDLQELAGSEDDALRALAADWVPIGSRVGSFGIQYTGIYCGNGYTVSGLRIKSNHGAGSNGLFGSVTGNGALLTGIHLRDVEITGTTGNRTGALAGYVSGATVTLCSAEGKIEATLSSGGASVGGLVGNAGNCSVNRCHTKVDIRAEVTLKGGGRAWAGGIVGWNLANGDGNTSTLFACRAEGSVSLTGAGTSTDAQPLCAGGIAGKNNNNNDYSNTDANILACVATGAVTAAYTGADAVQAWAGGLVGYLGEGGYLLYSYARGTATATAGGNASGHAGAIVGGYDGSSAVDFCFGAGEGGKGTSGLEERVGDIAYNTAPGDSEIWNIITSSDWIFPGISTTFYDASATPAYGINVSERNYNSDVWLRDDRCWPVLDMENNGN